MVIWKYPLQITDEQEIVTPVGAAPLSAQFQGDQLVLWMAVSPDAPMAPRAVYVVGTGSPVQMPLPVQYVGTAQEPLRPLVWHVYLSGLEALAEGRPASSGGEP